MEVSESKAYFDHKPGYGISKKRLQGITSLVGDLAGKTVLDIGCGKGQLGMYLKEKDAARVVGCDIADGAIALAQAELDEAFVYDVTMQNLAELCKEEQFDVVVATELIEHLFQPALLLKEVRTVLKPDGVFVVTTPNLLVWTNRIKMLLGRFEYTETGLMDESHVHFFTYHTLHSLLVKEGFVVEAEANVYNRYVPQWLAPYIPGLATYQMVFACKLK